MLPVIVSVYRNRILTAPFLSGKSAGSLGFKNLRPVRELSLMEFLLGIHEMTSKMKDSTIRANRTKLLWNSIS